jgi:hypothetical protein
MERGLTAMEALSTGGGLTQRGNGKRLRLHREAGWQVQAPQPEMDDILRDCDFAYVVDELVPILHVPYF